MAEDFEYEQEKITLEKGDFIFGFTDGITEAIDAKQHEFGVIRLEKVVLKFKDLDPDEMAQAVKNAVVDFTANGGSLFDDTTILVIRRE
jgi:sigma-B regulation protein RsbU (phosphoserine phosphatase)